MDRKLMLKLLMVIWVECCLIDWHLLANGWFMTVGGKIAVEWVITHDERSAAVKAQPNLTSRGAASQAELPFLSVSLEHLLRGRAQGGLEGRSSWMKAYFVFCDQRLHFKCPGSNLRRS